MKKIYRVYTNEPSNHIIDDKVCIKIFKDLNKAKIYYNKLLKEIKEDQKETDDDLYVVLEELSEDIQIDFAYVGDEE